MDSKKLRYANYLLCILNKKHCYRAFFAFSLIELLMVIAIGSIFLLISVPSWNKLIIRNHQAVQTNTIIAAIRFARSIAISSGQKVIFCASDNEVSCTQDWDQGQIVLDRNNKVLRIFPALSNSSQLFWRGNFGRNYLSFSPLGAVSAGKFNYYPQSGGKEAVTIIVNLQGRVRVVK